MQIPDGHYLFGTVKVGGTGDRSSSRRRPERSFTSNRGHPHRPGGREVGIAVTKSRRAGGPRQARL